MRLCNRCGCPVEANRYSVAPSSLCPECEEEVRGEMEPADDLHIDEDGPNSRSEAPTSDDNPSEGYLATLQGLKSLTKASLPADEALGRINEQLRDDLWREAHEARAELRAQLGAYTQGRKGVEQLAFSVKVVVGLIMLAAIGLALGANLAFWTAHYDVDGIRSEGVPVSCWHWRESR